MNIDNSFEPVVFRDVPAGGFYLWERDGAIHPCIKVEAHGGHEDEVCGVVLNHPETGCPTLLLGTVFQRSNSVLLVRNAALKPDGEPASFTFGNINQEPGMMVLNGQQMIMFVRSGRDDTSLVDVRSGQILHDVPRNPRVGLSNWKIVLGSERDAKLLFSFPPRMP